MDELSQILRPSWGAERWILEGWEQITEDEKQLIIGRMNALFQDGLPFKMKYDKLFYIYIFSLLAKLEVLAVQVPLKFRDQMSTPRLRNLLHQQLLDEIFHGMVFTKIVYLLCDPYANPPPYNDSIETLCNFIRNEECPKVGLMLLNLIGEGWIEEIFYSLNEQGVAPKVFAIILRDEHRHVCEADLFREIGVPDMTEVRQKMAFLENQLLMGIFLEYKYISSTCTLMGAEGTIHFLRALNKKHHSQLEKINLVPSENWYFFMKVCDELFPKLQRYAMDNHEIPMTPTSKVFMTQWDNPSDPTMVGQFNLNVSCLDFFNKKYPPETVTMVSMQAVSHALIDHERFRSFLSHNKLYQSKEAYMGLIVKLPDCGDQIGMIILENCHLQPFQVLTLRIREILKMMVFCYKKREELESKHPHLLELADNALMNFFHDVYGYPIPGSAIVSLSTIGACGYAQTKSPLRCNESMKFTLLEIERKPVWNHDTHAFEPQDIMPVSVSADHRIFDGNIPVPKIMASYFQTAFIKMNVDLTQDFKAKKTKQREASNLITIIEQLQAHNLEAAYAALFVLQTCWLDYMQLENILSQELTRELVNYCERVTA